MATWSAEEKADTIEPDTVKPSKSKKSKMKQKSTREIMAKKFGSLSINSSRYSKIPVIQNSPENDPSLRNEEYYQSSTSLEHVSLLLTDHPSYTLNEDHFSPLTKRQPTPLESVTSASTRRADIMPPSSPPFPPYPESFTAHPESIPEPPSKPAPQPLKSTSPIKSTEISPTSHVIDLSKGVYIPHASIGDYVPYHHGGVPCRPDPPIPPIPYSCVMFNPQSNTQMHPIDDNGFPYSTAPTIIEYATMAAEEHYPSMIPPTHMPFFNIHPGKKKQTSDITFGEVRNNSCNLAEVSSGAAVISPGLVTGNQSMSPVSQSLYGLPTDIHTPHINSLRSKDPSSRSSIRSHTLKSNVQTNTGSAISEMYCFAEKNSTNFSKADRTPLFR